MSSEALGSPGVQSGFREIREAKRSSSTIIIGMGLYMSKGLDLLFGTHHTAVPFCWFALPLDGQVYYIHKFNPSESSQSLYAGHFISDFRPRPSGFKFCPNYQKLQQLVRRVK